MHRDRLRTARTLLLAWPLFLNAPLFFVMFASLGRFYSAVGVALLAASVPQLFERDFYAAVRAHKAAGRHRRVACIAVFAMTAWPIRTWLLANDALALLDAAARSCRLACWRLSNDRTPQTACSRRSGSVSSKNRSHPVIPFYMLELPDYVSVIALTPARELLLVRQHRPVVGRETLELPSGHVDPGERPEDAARRELLEETGFDAPQPGTARHAGARRRPAWRTGCGATSRLTCAPSDAPHERESGVALVRSPSSEALRAPRTARWITR